MFRAKNRLGGKGTTLGVLVDGLGDPYQATICEGIEQGATHAGANLLLFVGGTLAGATSPVNPRQQLYDLAGLHNLDGLIVLSSTLSHEVGLAGMHAFCTRYAEVPLCSIGVPLPNAPSVTVDNEVGMAHVVRHIAKHHGAKRIAFISGPAANSESEMRVKAYHNVLAEHGLPKDEQLLVRGDFRLDSGALAVRTLAKSFGSGLERLDAIIAANDNMAIGAMDELRNMGISMPERIIVTGFDDSEEARLTEPSLTTARQPLERIGQEAVRRVLQTRRESEALEQRISTDLVVRQSCGCSALGLSKRTAPAHHERLLVALIGQRERIGAQLGRAARGRFAAAGSGWEQTLLGTLVDDLMAGSPQRFLPAAERLTQRLAAARVDLNAVEEMLTVLREELTPLLQGEPEKYRLAEDLLHAVHLATSAAIQRGLGRAHLELQRWAHRIAEACNTISATSDYTELRARIAEVLPKLGLRSCFVCKYETVGDSSLARVVVNSQHDRSESEQHGETFRGRDLLPLELATADVGGRSFAVLPLAGKHALLGHVLIEYTAQRAFTCGALADAISIALRNFEPS